MNCDTVTFCDKSKKRVPVEEKYIKAVQDVYSPADWSISWPFLVLF